MNGAEDYIKVASVNPSCSRATMPPPRAPLLHSTIPPFPFSHIPNLAPNVKLLSHLAWSSTIPIPVIVHASLATLRLESTFIFGVLASRTCPQTLSNVVLSFFPFNPILSQHQYFHILPSHIPSSSTFGSSLSVIASLSFIEVFYSWSKRCFSFLSLLWCVRIMIGLIWG